MVSVSHFETIPREALRLSASLTAASLDKLKDTNSSSSNLLARELKVSKTLSPSALKLKKIKLKKHNANRISSLKTIISKTHKMEATKTTIIK
jgi:hypothetical protein